MGVTPRGGQPVKWFSAKSPRTPWRSGIASGQNGSWTRSSRKNAGSQHDLGLAQTAKNPALSVVRHLLAGADMARHNGWYFGLALKMPASGLSSSRFGFWIWGSSCGGTGRRGGDRTPNSPPCRPPRPCQGEWPDRWRSHAFLATALGQVQAFTADGQPVEPHVTIGPYLDAWLTDSATPICSLGAKAAMSMDQPYLTVCLEKILPPRRT